SRILCQAQAGELPARSGREEVAVGGADVAGRGRAAAAAQDQLSAHELAVVFAERARQRAEARVRTVGARGPLPAVAGPGEVVGGGLPFGLGRQARARPAGEGIGLVVADVADRRRGIDGLPAGEREFDAAVGMPVERAVPAAALDL